MARQSSSVLAVEGDAGGDQHHEERRHDPVDDQAERRPPSSIGHIVAALLPKVLESMAGEAEHQQPRRSGDPSRPAPQRPPRRRSRRPGRTACRPLLRSRCRPPRSESATGRRPWPDQATRSQAATRPGCRRRQRPTAQVHATAPLSSLAPAGAWGSRTPYRRAWPSAAAAHPALIACSRR
jgi:hypothetical protein